VANENLSEPTAARETMSEPATPREPNPPVAGNVVSEPAATDETEAQRLSHRRAFALRVGTSAKRRGCDAQRELAEITARYWFGHGWLLD